MKINYCLLFVLLCLAIKASAQTPDARSLTAEGNEFSKQKDYARAMEKYKAALATDSTYAPANYQMGFMLNTAGRGLEAIPYLQRVFKSKDASVKLLAGSYSLAGHIYDEYRKPKESIDIYEKGIKALNNNTDTKDVESLLYNLSLAYFRNKQYDEAEQASKSAVKLDSTDASAQRVYALVTFHQNKRAEALLGFCSFLLLEPKTARSTEAYGNMQHILQGGDLKPEPGQMPIKPDARTTALNQAIAKSQMGFATKRYASAGDLSAAKLSAAINAITETNAKFLSDAYQKDKFFNYYGQYFGKLAQSPNMQAFARLISQNQPESANWIKAHSKEMADLDSWLKTTRREF